MGGPRGQAVGAWGCWVSCACLVKAPSFRALTRGRLFGQGMGGAWGKQGVTQAAATAGPWLASWVVIRSPPTEIGSGGAWC